MMTAGKRIFALALAAVLSLSAGVSLRAEPHGSATAPVTLKPLAAASFDAGQKHVLSYFVGGDGACRLTVIIFDAPSLEEATPATATTRLIVPISTGKSANLDTAVAKTLRFACSADAAAMTVTAQDRIAPRAAY
ncbi:hypothetical protein IY145_19455 [Methylosinus sp. H3A]|uniref:hypothetical protein n=1 Tax=Methylosinus sp. H3A TaxID=2785786 RepID=UPI0018C2BA16|nr:hypothetical protein [Methylosinus sp. H3A]MBG0811533.1 hypothetical protein [Methylosinus sp. H3A]